MEGIIAVLNETVSNVSKSFFSGLKDLKDKQNKKHTFVQDYALLCQKKHGYINLLCLGDHLWPLLPTTNI